jgi:hypothetical protein
VVGVQLQLPPVPVVAVQTWLPLAFLTTTCEPGSAVPEKVGVVLLVVESLAGFEMAGASGAVVSMTGHSTPPWGAVAWTDIGATSRLTAAAGRPRPPRTSRSMLRNASVEAAPVAPDEVSCAPRTETVRVASAPRTPRLICRLPPGRMLTVVPPTVTATEGGLTYDAVPVVPLDRASMTTGRATWMLTAPPRRPMSPMLVVVRDTTFERPVPGSSRNVRVRDWEAVTSATVPRMGRDASVRPASCVCASERTRTPLASGVVHLAGLSENAASVSPVTAPTLITGARFTASSCAAAGFTLGGAFDTC